MSRRPGGRLVRAVVPMAVCAALAGVPLWGAPPVRAITPEQAAAAGYIPNPAPALARITIDDVTPRVLDDAGAGGPPAVGTRAGVPTITVSGTISNVGDTPLESVDVRLQRGPRAAGAESVRAPLVWSEPSFGVRGEFVQVAAALDPGESVTYRVSMPAREAPGRPGPDLQLTEPGVYPLLVNVNGTPEGGSPARLDDARTLRDLLSTLDTALLPWIVASQTVPVLAIAPIVLVILGSLGFSGVAPKAVIAMYLCFFPVTVAMVQGLRSPQRIETEMMHTYAASRWQALWMPVSYTHLTLPTSDLV